MVTPFNRRELTAADSMAEEAEIRRALAGRGIQYQVRTVDTAERAVRAGGRAGMVDMGRAVQYIFYVRRRDFDQALEAIGRSEIP